MIKSFCEGDEMKKIVALLLSMICLFGCTQQSYPKFTVKMFYANWCGNCEGAKKQFIPRLEEEFGEAVTIEYYDIDSYEGYKAYFEIVESLENIDEELTKDTNVPFFVIEDRYAFFGCTTSFIDEYILDIKASLKGEALSEKMSPGRFYFKEKD